MDNLMLALTNNAGAWEGILNFFFSFIGNVGWCVVILTILIKLVISPFEFLQKKGMKKMTAAMQFIQPEMEKIKAKCGNNQALYNQKVQELYKKHNINPAAGCGPMFLYMVISSVVFITFFNCLRGVSTEQIVNQYNDLKTVYTNAYTYYMDEQPLEINGVQYKITASEREIAVTKSTQFEEYLEEYNNAAPDSDIKTKYATDTEYATFKRIEALSQQAVVDGINLTKKDDSLANLHLDGFTQTKQSFLWIKNIWRADHYNSVFPNADEFLSASGLTFAQKEFVINASQKDNYEQNLVTENNNTVTVKGYYQKIDGTVVTSSAEDGKKAFNAEFNTITKQINKTYSGWNGYLILVALIALLTIFSSRITNFGSKTRDKKGFEVDVKPQKQNYTMMIVLTGLFILIAWSYTAAFALYLVTSSLIGIPISIAMNYIMNALEKREATKNEISYSRYKKGDN